MKNLLIFHQTKPPQIHPPHILQMFGAIPINSPGLCLKRLPAPNWSNNLSKSAFNSNRKHSNNSLTSAVTVHCNDLSNHALVPSKREHISFLVRFVIILIFFHLQGYVCSWRLCLSFKGQSICNQQKTCQITFHSIYIKIHFQIYQNMFLLSK